MNKLYFDDSLNTLAEAFNYANDCNIDLQKFFDLFISTEMSKEFENSNPKFVSGLSGIELVISICKKANIKIDYSNSKPSFNYFEEYWIGYVLAYYQATTGIQYDKIKTYISIDEIKKLYTPLHEASEEKMVEVFNKIINERKVISNLQKIRKNANLSQSELANLSNVNLRTLQQYEIKDKDINKASVSTLISLSKVLNCKIEDILE